jgi:hypothetical protein
VILCARPTVPRFFSVIDPCAIVCISVCARALRLRRDRWNCAQFATTTHMTTVSTTDSVQQMSNELKRLTALVAAIVPSSPVDVVSAAAASAGPTTTPSTVDWSAQLCAVQADVAALRDQFHNVTATQQHMMAVLMELRADLQRTAPPAVQ